MKVAFVNGINSSLDASRGIGVATQELLKHINLQITPNPKDADVTHYLKLHPFFVSLPFFKPSKKVVLTVYDLVHLIYPKHYPPGVKGSISFIVNKFLIWKNVDAVITISETSKKDICRFLGVDPKKVFVIYLAPKEEYKPLVKIKNKYNLPKEFVFYFGGINYNKNLPTLIEACKLAKIPLVIAGKQAVEIETMDLNHPENSHLKNLDFKNVIRLGYINDEDANEIYNLAKVCVQPSFYEGFGFSVIHAMAAGCPVIAAKTQSLVEIAEDAAVFFDPNSAQDLAKKIKSVNRNLVKKGLARATQFTWEKTAKQTLEVYKNA